MPSESPQTTIETTSNNNNNNNNVLKLSTNALIAVLSGIFGFVLVLCCCMILLFIYCSKKKSNNNDNGIKDIQFSTMNSKRLSTENKNKNNKRLTLDGHTIDLQNTTQQHVTLMSSLTPTPIASGNDHDTPVSNDTDVDVDVDAILKELENNINGNNNNNDIINAIKFAINNDDDIDGDNNDKDEELYSSFEGQNSNNDTTTGGTSTTEAKNISSNSNEINIKNWSQKDVSIWLKYHLVKNNFESQVISLFLKEFGKKNIDGKQLIKMKDNNKLIDQLKLQFTNKNQENAIWYVVKNSINKLPTSH